MAQSFLVETNPISVSSGTISFESSFNPSTIQKSTSQNSIGVNSNIIETGFEVSIDPVVPGIYPGLNLYPGENIYPISPAYPVANAGYIQIEVVDFQEIEHHPPSLLVKEDYQILES